MGHGSEHLDLGMAKAQIQAAGKRMAGKDGVQDQTRYMRVYLAELFLGSLFGFLLFATLFLAVIDPPMAIYSGAATAISALAFVTVKVRSSMAIRKKREHDLRQLAMEKDKTNKTMEAQNA